MLGPEDKVIELKDFNGIWARGNSDEVPQDHLIDCLNMALSSKGKATTRPPINSAMSIDSYPVVRMFQSSILPQPASQLTVDQLAWIFMDNASNLYLGSSGSPLINISGMTDFAGLNMFNRTFIAPSNGRFGYVGSLLYIFYNYLGTNLIRPAAGLPPIGSAMGVTNSGTPGNNTPGEHAFAVLYVTDTGYQTAPGPQNVFATFTLSAVNNATQIVTGNDHGLVTGQSVYFAGFGGSLAAINGVWIVNVINDTTFTIALNSSALSGGFGSIHGLFSPSGINSNGNTFNLTGIPTGPSYVVQRQIIVTQAGGTEFFFIANGLINDNTTTTFNNLDFFDTDLVISADAQFDLMWQIPAGTGLCKYNGRLVITGAYGYGGTALISQESQPEAVSSVVGYVTASIENDGNNLVSCWILRDILYLGRQVGFYYTQDNGGDPSTWPVNIADATVGSYQNGLCSFTTTQSGSSDTGDIILLAAREGLYIFDGTVRRPELSFKIQDLWSQIPVANGVGGQNYVQVCQSVWTHQIFIAYPSTPSSVYPDALLVGDYDPIPGVLDPLGIRWSRFSFAFPPTCIKTGSNLYVATINATGHLYILDPTQVNDFGSVAINNYLQTYLATPMPGWVNFFKAFRLRINATGTVTVSLFGEDGVLTATVPATGNIINILASMTQPSGKEFLQLINFVNEKMSLKIGTNALNANFNLNRLEIFSVPRWQVRPG
jgi:hypothetical protein